MDKVIDIQDRIPSMREKRRRKTNKKFIFILAVFCIALLFLLYFQSPLSKIGTIHVKGSVLQDDQFYIQKSGIETDGSFWGFKVHDVQQALTRLEGVQQAKVSRKWFHDVEISITEWKTVAYLEEKGQYNILLENGETFHGETIKPDVPILSNLDDVKVAEKIIKQLLKMDKNVFQLISEIIYTGDEVDTDSLVIYMDDGYEVHAKIPSLAEKMEYYPEITAQLSGYEKGIIDMEVGTFFTPFSEAYGTGKEGEVDEEESE
ncbi:cell division protein FtsQ/DivIB [Sporosarcina sp. Te-1]|uniref:cell division protein FtsQ/DivIB n=1 Tax=Sporosarcina sp. Te-1 TaxID=2818390 RepID=UPI001A9F78D1|nr:FtsQ-type POTRA domain-containing protein [Sporosarcina sp. Te-1]QTD42402.1 FtsQ-type POTRA domain-containing protein [Sporosarcina sp. Te-1]